MVNRVVVVTDVSSRIREGVVVLRQTRSGHNKIHRIMWLRRMRNQVRFSHLKQVLLVVRVTIILPSSRPLILVTYVMWDRTGLPKWQSRDLQKLLKGVIEVSRSFRDRLPLQIRITAITKAYSNPLTDITKEKKPSNNSRTCQLLLNVKDQTSRT